MDTNTFLTELIAGWQISRRTVGDRWFAVRLAAFLAPWLHAALLSVGFRAVVRRQYRRAALATALVGFFGWQSRWRLTRAQPTSGSGELRLLTFNVNHANRSDDGLQDMIEKEAPDIVCFQEIEPELSAHLYPSLSTTFRHHAVYKYWYTEGETDKEFRLEIYSRYPLLELPRPDAPLPMRAYRAVVATPRGEVVLWVVHPVPPVGRSWARHIHVLREVAADVAKERGPVIVAGDFNATPYHESYRLIASHLTDVQYAAGRGPGFTCPDYDRELFDVDAPDPKFLSWLPAWVPRATVKPLLGQVMHRIPPAMDLDHIFVSDHFTPLDTHVIATNHGSDHRPVVATLRLRR